MRSLRTWMMVAALCASACAVQAQQQVAPEVARQGAEVYRQHCAMCHDQPQGRTPSRGRLTTTRSADYVLRVLTVGVMSQQSAALSAEQKTAVAAFLIGRMPGAGSGMDINANRCTTAAPPMTLDGPAWNGWDGSGTTNMRFQREPGLATADIPRLKLKWVFGYLAGASSPPTIAGGRLFTPSMGGVVYALDPASGCTYWATDLGLPLRTPISVTKLPSGRHALFVGDGKGDIHALDAETGQEIWRQRVEEHPSVRLTGAPMLHERTLYVPVSSIEESSANSPGVICCTFRGSVVALDTATGRKLWQGYTIDDPAKKLADGHRMGPSGAAVWSAPTVDPVRGVVYVATGNGYSEPAVRSTNAVIAFDLRTGRKRWEKQLLAADVWLGGCGGGSDHDNCPGIELGPDYDLGSSPLLVRAPDGKERLVVLSKSGEVFALDPDRRGSILWQTRAGSGGLFGGIEWGGASDGENIYVSVSDTNAPLAGAANSDTSKPGNPARRGVSALSAATGKLLWHTPAAPSVCAWGTPCANVPASAPLVIPGAVFSGSWDGHERAYSTTDGRLLWEGNAGGSHDAVNGGQAQGGSMDTGGQIIAGGRLFVTAGARNGQAGNALLAYTVDGR